MCLLVSQYTWKCTKNIKLIVHMIQVLCSFGWDEKNNISGMHLVGRWSSGTSTLMGHQSAWLDMDRIFCVSLLSFSMIWNYWWLLWIWNLNIKNQLDVAIEAQQKRLTTEIKNATWRWSEPTCFLMIFIRHCTEYYVFELDLSADLDPRELWPWPVWPLTLTHVTLDL